MTDNALVLYRQLTPARFVSVEEARNTIGAHREAGDALSCWVVADDCRIARQSLADQYESVEELMKDLTESNNIGWRRLYDLLRIGERWPTWEQRYIGQLKSTHFLIALEEDPEEADNWLVWAASEGWSTRELRRQIRGAVSQNPYAGDPISMRGYIWRRSVESKHEYTIKPDTGIGPFAADGELYDITVQELNGSQVVEGTSQVEPGTQCGSGSPMDVEDNP